MNYKQIDYLKAFCIFSVILLHTLSIETLYSSFAVLHIWNAVPIFILLMAFTSSISFNKNTLEFKDLYSVNYFVKRFNRIVLPLIPVFIITLIIGVISKKTMNLGLINLIGIMPLNGKGNYYISILFQFILLSPILYYFYKKSPRISLFASLIINLVFELSAKIIFLNSDYLYSACILRYIFLIFLGYYLFDIIANKKQLNKLFYFGLLISILYLFLINSMQTSINLFLPQWKTQLFITVFYPFFLTYLGIKYFNFKSKLLIEIGKASYHIFLVQMVYFIINPSKIIGNIFIEIPANLIICILVGYIFFKVNSIIVEKVK